jgi:NAD(P)H-dependent FMN reductase
MRTISIISSSIRTSRKSHNVALYLLKYISDNYKVKVEILDLKNYNFPIFDAPLKYQDTPSLEVLEFKNKINSADGIIIVTPEYNGSFPASLKNIIDLLFEEWIAKPIAFSTVSSGEFGGLQALTQLQFVFWKLKALPFSINFPVSKVQDKFDYYGEPTNKEIDGYTKLFIDGFFETIKK